MAITTFPPTSNGGGGVSSVGATAPVTSSGGTTPTIAMPAATTSVNGYLTSTDWNTFNGKQPSGSYLTAITADAPLSGSGTSGSHLVIAAANTTTSGYLTSTDWNTFNGKSNTNGTVTSVAALTLGTTGTDLSSTVATGTTTPAITLQVPTASATNRGALSSTDWATFNGKQAALTSGTNIKTVGGASLLGSGDAGTIGLAYGGTGVTSAPAAMANLMGFTTTATSATPVVLTNTSSYYQIFTGSTAQTVTLPVTSTLAQGWTFHICNNSTAIITVNSSGSNLVLTVLPGTTVMYTCILTSGTTAADWEAGYTDFSSVLGNDGTVPMTAQWYLSAAGGALSGATQNYFGANSAVSLNAAGTYDIEAHCYFLKTTSGTVTWIPAFSSAATVAHAILDYTPVTGFTTTNISGAMVTAEATQQTVTNMTFAATAALTTAVYHVHKLRIRVTTNLACNFRLNATISAGSITPQAGSWYTARKIAINSGTFVA